MRFNVRTLRSASAGHRLAERRFRWQFYQFHPDAVRVREIGVVHLRCLVECNVTHRSAPLLEHRGNRRQVLHLQSKVWCNIQRPYRDWVRSPDKAEADDPVVWGHTLGGGGNAQTDYGTGNERRKAAHGSLPLFRVCLSVARSDLQWRIT